MQQFGIYFKKNIKLAIPITIGQLGFMIASWADNIMVGKLGYNYLAASSLGNSILILFLLFGTGFSIAITTIVGRAVGAYEHETIKKTYATGFWVNVLIGIVLCISMITMISYVEEFGQDKTIAALSKPYSYLLAISLIPQMIFLHLKQFTEGMQQSLPATVIGVAGNILNIGLNYLLIYGQFGFPALGLFGAGIATLTFRTLTAVVFYLFIRESNRYQGYIEEISVRSINLLVGKTIWKTGWPMGLQFSLEAGGFTVGTIMVGWLGGIALASHQIALSIVNTTFLAASGIASAATIRISKLIGKKLRSNIRLAGYVALLQVLIFMLMICLILYVYREEIPFIFVTDENVIGLASELLLIAALFQVFDGIQVVSLGALRGMNDIKYPALISIVSYWIIGIPTGYILCFTFEKGTSGVWYGYAISLAASAIILTYRFISKTNKKKLHNKQELI